MNQGNVYLKLENYLREKILKNEFNPEFPIYTEKELEQMFMISRKSVRKAVQNLVDEGLLIKKAGHGTFVIPPEQRRSKTKRKQLKIVMILPFLKGVNPEYTNRLIEGAAEYAFRHGHQLQCNDQSVNYEDIIEQYKSNELDGIIWDTPRDYENIILKFQKQTIPQVTINHTINGICSLSCDHIAELEEPVSFLAEIGHKKIAFINYDIENNPYIGRRNAYLEAIEKTGNKPIYAATMGENLNNTLDIIFKSRPTALIIGGHVLLPPALMWLAMNKIRLKSDISLISLNDSYIAKVNNPPISVFTEPREEIGASAIRFISGLAAKQIYPGEQKELKGDLIIRKSCGMQR